MTKQTLHKYPCIVKALRSVPSALFHIAKRNLDTMATSREYQHECCVYLQGVVDSLYELGKIEFDDCYNCQCELYNYVKRFGKSLDIFN